VSHSFWRSRCGILMEPGSTPPVANVNG
jgi:hypothetical protein